jgi:nitrogen regulatory protein PII
MEKIEAIILPSTLDAVRAERERLGIHAALTLTEVRQPDGDKLSFPTGSEAIRPLEVRLKVELVVGDRQAQRGVNTIMQYAQVAKKRAAGHVALLRVTEALQMLPPLLMR